MCLGVPGQIVSITNESPMTRCGTVSFGGITKEVNLVFVEGARVGDYVVVHVGFAISLIDEEEARRVFDYLKEIEQLDELEDV